MNQNLSKAFKNIAEFKSPEALEKRILKAINQEIRRKVRIKIFFIYAGFLSSAGIFVYAVINFWSALANSEFWNLLSLSISDAGTVFRYGGDYIFSLLETFPVAIVIMFLVPVFLMLFSLASYFKINNNHLKHLT